MNLEQQLIDPDLEMRIEDTRSELMISILKGSANRWFSFIAARRAIRITERAIDYIYYSDDDE